MKITYVIWALRTQKSVLHAQPGERMWQPLCWYGKWYGLRSVASAVLAPSLVLDDDDRQTKAFRKHWSKQLGILLTCITTTFGWSDRRRSRRRNLNWTVNWNTSRTQGLKENSRWPTTNFPSRGRHSVQLFFFFLLARNQWIRWNYIGGCLIRIGLRVKQHSYVFSVWIFHMRKSAQRMSGLIRNSINFNVQQNLPIYLLNCCSTAILGFWNKMLLDDTQDDSQIMPTSCVCFKTILGNWLAEASMYKRHWACSKPFKHGINTYTKEYSKELRLLGERFQKSSSFRLHKERKPKWKHVLTAKGQ